MRDQMTGCPKRQDVNEIEEAYQQQNQEAGRPKQPE
jgi:hypothetical protein